MATLFSKLERRLEDGLRNAKNFFVRDFQKTTATWHNWAGNQTTTPVKIFHPHNVHDLKRIVQDATKAGRGVRCVAEGHSWSSISNTNDFLVDVTELTALEVKKSEKYGWTVTAESGTPLSKIDETLKAHVPPLTMVSATVLDNVRVGGVVATGSHGAMTSTRTIPEQVVSMTIISGDGEEHEFSDEIDPLEMSAARVNLGLLGIIYTVTFQVKPMYKLRMTDSFPLVSSWLNPATLKELVKNSDGIEIFYWPFNSGGLNSTEDRMWVKQWVRTEDPVTESQFVVKAERVGQELELAFGDKLYEFIIDCPDATPHICQLLFQAGFRASEAVLLTPDAIHYEHGIDNIPCWDLEFVFKADDDMSNVVEGVQMIIDKVYENAKKGKYPMNLAAEFRICKSSQALLSPAYNSDPEAIYCFLEVLCIKGTEGFQEFSTELADTWMKRWGAQPHWAKMWEYVPGVHARLRAQPGNSERFAKFEQVRKKYDPKGTFFGNPSLKAVLLGDRLPPGFDPRIVPGSK